MASSAPKLTITANNTAYEFTLPNDNSSQGILGAYCNYLVIVLIAALVNWLNTNFTNSTATNSTLFLGGVPYVITPTSVAAPGASMIYFFSSFKATFSFNSNYR